MTTSIKEKIRAILQLAIWVLPVPFGAFASDRSFFAPMSLFVFFVLSISMPITMRLRQMKRDNQSVYASPGAIAYGSIIVLLVAVGLLNGLMSYPFWQHYVPRVLAFTCWMVVTVCLQVCASWSVSFWQRRIRTQWFSEFLDPVLYSFPIPCALMGMFLFPAVANNEITQSLIIGIIGIIGFGFMAMGIIALAVIAFYFFPKRELPRRERAIQLIRIIVMAVVWIGSLEFLFASDKAIFTAIIFQGIPVAQNNFFVFITPFITVSVLLIAAIAISNMAVLVMRRFLA